jgi:hypothetical protein
VISDANQTFSPGGKRRVMGDKKRNLKFKKKKAKSQIKIQNSRLTNSDKWQF